jgi:hypothetical protein
LIGERDVYVTAKILVQWGAHFTESQVAGFLTVLKVKSLRAGATRDIFLPALWNKKSYQSGTCLVLPTWQFKRLRTLLPGNDSNNFLRAIFETPTAVLINTTAFWDMTLCGLMFWLPAADVSEQFAAFSVTQSIKGKTARLSQSNRATLRSAVSQSAQSVWLASSR